ncbi:hypothetical protein KIMH_02170 [Bombiscardovia apis]|uniref:Uncharacterized protein n=2 Tax=Bombiscardovia apis TaxID=2932182 RepID=A0ABM8BBW5_9BIFI|nr:hypothetical protein KIMH_02170 [Bombiscardovia apis]
MPSQCILAVLLTLLTFGRLALSLTLHMWYAYTQRADDALLMSYSLPEYPHSHDYYKLAKNQAYGFFLRFVSWSHINIDLVYFGVWLLAALCTAFALYRFFHITWLAVVSYCYILYNPLAFENWLGTRIYRNSLIVPSLFILLALLVLYLTSTPLPQSGKFRPFIVGTWVAGQVLFYCLLGAVFAFIYDLKEDSVWLLPMFVFVVIVKLIQILRMHGSWMYRGIALSICLLPLLSAAVTVKAVTTYNKRNFGIALLNTRTQGQVAGFVSRVYQVKSDHQTPYIWAPADSLDAVERVSPTLQSKPEIMDYVQHKDFAAPDIHIHPLEGDFLTWQMIAAIDNSIGMDHEPQIQDFFRSVNQEIDAAFHNGDLKHTNKIALSSSLPARTPAQIGDLFGPSFDMMGDTLTLARYYELPHNRNTTNIGKHAIPNRIGLRQLNIDIHNPNPQVLPWLNMEQARAIVQVIVVIYRIANLAACLAFALTLVLGAKQLWYKHWNVGLAATGLSLCLVLYAFVYAFSVAWFIEYTRTAYYQFFFTVGSITPLIGVALLLSLGSLVSLQQAETLNSRAQHRRAPHRGQPSHKARTNLTLPRVIRQL